MNLDCLWRLERAIGQGAYGVVYLAIGSGGERAAVKVCRYQIRKRLTARLRETNASVLSEMDTPRGMKCPMCPVSTPHLFAVQNHRVITL